MPIEQFQGLGGLVWVDHHLPPPGLAGVFDNVNVPVEAPNMKFKSTMTGRSTSQLSGEYLDLTSQIIECQESCRRELGELERVLSDISRQVEVVRDIGSQVRTQISNLQTVASRLETWRQTLPQPSSPDSEKVQPASHFVPLQAYQPAEAGLKQVAPGLWQLGQV